MDKAFLIEKAKALLLRTDPVISCVTSPLRCPPRPRTYFRERGDVKEWARWGLIVGGVLLSLSKREPSRARSNF